MAEEGLTSSTTEEEQGTDTTEREKSVRKSADITNTPVRATVTPNGKQQREREQDPPKKSRGEVKKGIKDYFGEGKRVLAPSTEGDPVTTVVSRRESRAAKSVRADEDLTIDKGQNKKARSDDEESEEDEGKNAHEGAGRKGVLEGFAVDLESIGTQLKKKGTKTNKGKKKIPKDATGEKKKKASFQLQEETQVTEEKKGEEEVPICFKCVVGFAIRVDKGNNAKGGFDKKMAEGLAFLREYLDKATCILPSGKDQRLGPIKSKTDIPKYQVTMKNYFNIPNPMAFSNVNQEGGRVIKGSAVMGFSIDPKECLDDAAGDLRSMGCSLFYKKCQEVDTVSKLILLGAPNSIEEEVIQATMNTVLTNLEITLLNTDSEYKLTKEQRNNWIKYAVVKEFPPGMPWEDAEEKKKKQGTNNARLAYVLQVYQPDYERMRNLCQIAKQRKLWLQHWGNAAFTVEIPENDSQQGEKTRYIQMVQTHGSVQLSLGAASINGIVDAESHFTLRLTPDVDGKPREPTTASLREIFRMMEVEGRKVWICMARGSKGNYTGYFSSVVTSISSHVLNFVSCPGAQVYWWLRRRGCIVEDVNKMVRHCFTLDQQQKITRSKYVSEKGYAILNENDSDDIINATAGEGIYDMSLGLSDKELRTAVAGKSYEASAILFGEAKEGAVEAHNFSSSASVTTIHSKNMGGSGSVKTAKTLAKSIFSMGTSQVTSEGSDEEMEDSESEDEAGPQKPGVAIEGMNLLTSKKPIQEPMQEDDEKVTEGKEEGRNDGQDSEYEVESRLTTKMNAATKKLQLSSEDEIISKNEEDEESGDSIEGEESIVNPNSEDEGGEDFSEDDISAHQEDHNLGDEYETASEVSSGVFDAAHADKFENPENFKQLLWNIAGPSTGSMAIMLGLLKDDLEDDQEGLPADFSQIPLSILEFMVKEAGEDRGDQIKFIEEIMEDVEKLGQNATHTEASPDEGGVHQHKASKTQGTLPGAQKASPTDEAAIEPAIMTGRDKEGAQSLSMAPTG